MEKENPATQSCSSLSTRGWSVTKLARYFMILLKQRALGKLLCFASSCRQCPAKCCNVSWCFSQDGPCCLWLSGHILMLVVICCLLISCVFFFHSVALCCKGVKAPFPANACAKRAVVSCFLESGLIFPPAPPHWPCSAEFLAVSKLEEQRFVLSLAALMGDAQILRPSGWHKK